MLPEIAPGCAGKALTAMATVFPEETVVASILVIVIVVVPVGVNNIVENRPIPPLKSTETVCPVAVCDPVKL